MSIAPVSLDSLSLNGVLARLAGASRPPVQAVASSDATADGVLRPPLEPTQADTPADAADPALNRSVDGDLLDLSYQAKLKLRVRVEGSGAGADPASLDDASLRFDLKFKQDLRFRALDGDTGALLQGRIKTKAHVQFSIDYETFQQLMGDPSGATFADLLAAGQVAGDDDADEAHERDDDHDEDDSDDSPQQSAPPPASAAGDGSPSPAPGDAAPSDEEQQRLAELRAADAEVRAHEAAHLSAAGGLAQGGASFETTTGPDGKEYAVSGEVSVDTSPASTPQETIEKAQRIRKAALAPASPSSQDRAVAAKAAQMEAKARAELAKETGAGDAADKQAPDADDASSPARAEQASPPARSNETAPSFARVEQATSFARVEQSASFALRFDLTRTLLGGALDLVA